MSDECIGRLEYSDTGLEPEFLPPGKDIEIKQDRVQEDKIPVAVRQRSLSGMAEDFYLFALGPLVVGASVSFDIVTQFAADMGEWRIGGMETIYLQKPFLRGIPHWDNIVQAIPKDQHMCFSKYVKQMTFTYTRRPPYDYWIPRSVTCMVPDDGFSVLKTAVDVFYPTGIRADFTIHENLDSTYHFVAESPDPVVFREAKKYFQAIGLLKGSTDGGAAEAK